MDIPRQDPVPGTEAWCLDGGGPTLWLRGGYPTHLGAGDDQDRFACRKTTKKLDDGWPESVEEQGLLLLVLRHYITRQYIKDVL